MATYYVKTGGNDSAAGTSDGTAWANHPWMSSWTGSVTLAAGDTVYMNRGNTWTKSSSGDFLTVAQNGTSGNYITTAAYGTGNQPLIRITVESAGNVIAINGKAWLIFDDIHLQHYSGIWSDTYLGSAIRIQGHYSNTNTGTMCHDITVTNCTMNQLPYAGVIAWGNNYNLIVGDVNATTTATTSSYSNHIYDYGYVGVGLNGVNTSTDVSNFQVYYNYIHDCSGRPINNNGYGIFFTKTSESKMYPCYGYMRYNNVQKIRTWEGLDIHGGSYIYMQDNYVKDFGNFGIMISGGVTMKQCDHIYIDRNIIEQGTDYTAGAGRSFITIFNSIGTNTSELYVRDNILFHTTRPSSGTFAGIDVGSLSGVTISGNKIYNGGIAAGKAAISVEENYGSTGNKNYVISKNFIKHWGPGIDLEGPTIQGSVYVTQNIVTKTPSASFRIFGGQLSSTGLVYLYNNVFLNDSYAYCSYSTHGTASGSAIYARNNIFGRATNGALYYWYFAGTVSGTFTSDYNIYWNTSTASPFYYGGGERSWTYWTSTLGKDLNSPNTSSSLNPEFSNAGGSYLLDTDFEIGASSPAIDRGTDVGLTFDYFGNTIGLNPDIGIHEYLLQTTYYIDNSGVDTASRNGSVGQEWATLSYACSRAVTSGDIIHVNAGTYNESNYASVAVGVTITGAGDTSHLIYSYSNVLFYNACIRLTSTSEGTNGNQSISYLKIDGNNSTAKFGMYVKCRSNVDVHHLTMLNFHYNAINFYGHTSQDYWTDGLHPPTTWSTGNKLHHCAITNSCNMLYNLNSTGHGMIRLKGQEGMLIYDNTLTQTGAASGYNGNIIDGIEGYVKNLKYYNNKSYKPFINGTERNFHWESWHVYGGIEVYDNEFHGGGPHIDVAGHYNNKNTYNYSWWIHDNLFFQSSVQAKGSATYTSGIKFEGSSQYAYVNNNRFTNLPIPIYFVVADTNGLVTDIHIYNNILENVGYTDTTLCAGIWLGVGSYTGDLQRIYIRNNTITAHPFYSSDAGIHFLLNDTSGVGAAADLIYIQNNIVTGFSQGPIRVYSGNGQVYTVYNENNVFFGNGNNNNIIYSSGEYIVTLYESAIIKLDPKFVAIENYHLQVLSPAIDVGLNLDIITDYDYILRHGNPDIGAYEYVGSPIVTTTTITDITINSATSGGNVTNSGGQTVTARGICWNTTGNPTIANSHTINGSGTGVYVSYLTSLLENTHYYVRAYATNSSGTAYGSVVEFDTLESGPDVAIIGTIIKFSM